MSNFGGKAKQLINLKESGFNVPPFIVLSHAQLTNKNFDLTKYLTKLDFAEHYAVRSSASIEDGKEKSYAGLFHTELNVCKDKLYGAIQKVIKSAYENHLRQYASIDSIQMNVIIQKMIEADISGVAFSINPLNGHPLEVVINSVFGLGEGLVSGEITADEYIIRNGKTKSKIADKNYYRNINPIDGGTILIKNNIYDTTESTLNSNQINEIVNLVYRLKEVFSFEVDIEFCIKDNILYLLQCRPVTSKINEIFIFDNSNIIESYPGVTSPLTFSFIQKMYAAVYIQLSRLMGISSLKIRTYQHLYSNMLAHIHGRVYYNLNSWFGVLALLPMYKLNAKSMEQMMGVKESFPINISTKKESKPRIYLDLVLAVIKMLWLLISLKSTSKKFNHNFQKAYEKYNSIDLGNKSDMEIQTILNSYQRNLLKEWKAPLINDFFAMIFFSAFHKFVVKHNRGEANLHNELLTHNLNIISTEPADLNIVITNEIQKNTDTFTYFVNTDANLIWEEIIKNTDQVWKQKIIHYIKKWGYRSVGELKLETITYFEAPVEYIKFLQKLVVNQTKKKQNNTGPQKVKQDDFYQQLNFLNKLLFTFLLKKTRYLISNREYLRYQRTRAYGFVRKIYRELGLRWEQREIIENKEDIFFLHQEEIESCIVKKNTQIKATCEARKKSQKENQNIKLPERIESFTLDVNYVIEDERTITHQQKQNVLQGIPCCSGVVIAQACVLESPLDVDNLSGKILVTSSTDPGWIGLFPSASGILVERGSLLSHSAIVSREMGKPCIVGIKDLLLNINSGDLIEMDGATGKITLHK